jgi:hypothetical protein
MFRITLMAAVALYGATAAAQGLQAGVDGATGRGGGSTGPTFPAPDSGALIATVPTPTDVDVRMHGQPATGTQSVDSDASSQGVSPSGGVVR